jgi:hypothetical protein
MPRHAPYEKRLGCSISANAGHEGQFEHAFSLLTKAYGLFFIHDTKHKAAAEKDMRASTSNGHYLPPH